MQEYYDFGLILRKLRTDAGLSQQELGEKINRDKGIISRYENNYQTPPFETIRDLAAIFNVSMDYLAGTEKQGTISCHGLSEEQTALLARIAEQLKKSRVHNSTLTPEQAEVVSELVRTFVCGE